MYSQDEMDAASGLAGLGQSVQLTCTICTEVQDQANFINMPCCGQSLCTTCYGNPTVYTCPFCRAPIPGRQTPHAFQNVEDGGNIENLEEEESDDDVEVILNPHHAQSTPTLEQADPPDDDDNPAMEMDYFFNK